MEPGDVMFGRFLVTLPSALIIGVIVLFVVYRIIDGELYWPAGLATIFGLLFLLYYCIWPPHPAIPGVILISLVAMAALAPFVESKMGDLMHREIEADQLERAILAWHMRPDNVAAQLQVALRLQEVGFTHHAIQVGRAALGGIKEVHDDFANRSLRDQFDKEARQIAKWQAQGPPKGVKCPSCGTVYGAGVLTCEKCRTNYVLDVLRLPTNRPRFWGRMAASMVAVALLITGAAGFGLAENNATKWFSVVGAVLLTGAILGALFGLKERRRWLN